MKYYILFYLLFIPYSIFAYGHSVAGTSGGGLGEGSTGEGGLENGVSLTNPLGDVTLIGLFETILGVVMIFAVPLITFFIIYAGFKYVTARGNEQTISEAHKALLYALIGGLLILGANVLIDVIQGTVDSVIK